MTAAVQSAMTSDQIKAFHRSGFHIARGLIPKNEIQRIRDHFQEMHRNAPIYEIYQPDMSSTDPLKRFPRFMQPHRYDSLSRRYLLDPRILGILRAVIGEEPHAAQSMYYFKPPGATGQEFHQDNFYLMATPGTCFASWLAIDDADHGNGGLMVCPGLHLNELATPSRGTAKEWGSIIPQPTSDTVEVNMTAGDCLFFGGSLIHGSLANTSADRWRRSFICHYVGASTTKQVAAYYHPIITPEGEISDIGAGFDLPPGSAT